MARFDHYDIDDDDDEIVVVEKENVRTSNAKPWQDRWWNEDASPGPDKEEGEILEYCDDIDERPIVKEKSVERQHSIKSFLSQNVSFNSKRKDVANLYFEPNDGLNHDDNCDTHPVGGALNPCPINIMRNRRGGFSHNEASVEIKEEDDSKASTSLAFPVKLNRNCGNYCQGGIQMNRSMSPFHSPLSNAYNDPPVQVQQTKQISSFIWRAIKVLILAIVFQKYAPPPPPQHLEGGTIPHKMNLESNTWGEYMFYRGQDAMSSFGGGLQTLWYVLCGCASNAYQDGIYNSNLGLEWAQAILNGKNNKQCSLSLPDFKQGGRYASTEGYLLNKVIGQDRAMREIANAVDAWDVLDESKGGKGKPLSILLTGTKGVGKLETARVLSNLFLKSCNENVLELQGADFSEDIALPRSTSSVEMDDEVHYDSQVTNLRSRILGHVKSQEGAGAVIILKHIEYMAENALNELIRLLNRSTSMVPHDLIADGNSKVFDIRLDNVLFVLTTDIGIHNFFWLLAKSGNVSSMPYRELQNLVKKDLPPYFGDYVPSLVVPFFPLGFSEMKGVMEQKITDLSTKHQGIHWKQLYVPDQALDYFISESFITYFVFEINSENKFLHAEHGGHDLESNPLIRTIKAQVKRGSLSKPEEIAMCDYNTKAEQFIFSWCQDGDDSQNWNCNEQYRTYV